MHMRNNLVDSFHIYFYSRMFLEGILDKKINCLFGIHHNHSNTVCNYRHLVQCILSYIWHKVLNYCIHNNTHQDICCRHNFSKSILWDIWYKLLKYFYTKNSLFLHILDICWILIDTRQNTLYMMNCFLKRNMTDNSNHIYCRQTWTNNNLEYT